MKYCNQCGAEMADEAAFCPKCGQPVAEKVEPEVVEAAKEEAPKAEVKVEEKKAPTSILVLGIISIVISFLSLAICYVPIFGLVPAGAGLGTGIPAITKGNKFKKEGGKFPVGSILGIVGVVLNGIAALVGLIFILLVIGIIGD